MTEVSDDKIPVKYVLYSHYPEKKDFQAWEQGQGEQPFELEGVQVIISPTRSLRELLTSPGHEGLLVLFYAPGLRKCFDGIEQGKTVKQLLEEPELQFAKEVQKHVVQEFL